jgi:hypothetical protein
MLQVRSGVERILRFAVFSDLVLTKQKEGKARERLRP